MAEPARPAGDGPRLGWRAEGVVVAVLVAITGMALLQDARPKTVPTAARRDAIAPPPAGANRTIGRRERVAGEAAMVRSGPGESHLLVAKLDPGGIVYVFDERHGWKRTVAAADASEPVRGWIPGDQILRLAGQEAAVSPRRSVRFREVLAEEIQNTFLGRYLYATVKATGEHKATLRIRASRATPPLAHRFGQDLDWAGLRSAGFEHFELTDGSRTYTWEIPD